MNRIVIAALSFALVLLAGTANAQSAAAPAAAATTGAPKVNCVKPDEHPGRLATDARRKAWTKDVGDWQDCMKAAITAMQQHSAEVIKSANALIDEYNTGTKAFQEQVNAANR